MPTQAIQNILVATDLEPSGVGVLEYAFGLAEKLAAKVHIVHAYPPVVVPDGYGSGSIPYEELHLQSVAAVQALAQPFAGSACMGSCTADLGDALTVILEKAKMLSVDLIVLGTHARKGVQRILLGSIAEAVLREASGPVLIVKPSLVASAARDATSGASLRSQLS